MENPEGGKERQSRAERNEPCSVSGASWPVSASCARLARQDAPIAAPYGNGTGAAGKTLTIQPNQKAYVTLRRKLRSRVMSSAVSLVLGYTLRSFSTFSTRRRAVQFLSN